MSVSIMSGVESCKESLPRDILPNAGIVDATPATREPAEIVEINRRLLKLFLLPMKLLFSLIYLYG
jgi:hypothetical protein